MNRAIATRLFGRALFLIALSAILLSSSYAGRLSNARAQGQTDPTATSTEADQPPAETEPVSTDSCDPEKLAASEDLFNQLTQAEKDNPGSVSHLDLQNAAAQYILESERCYQVIAADQQAQSEPTYIDEGGLWAPGYIMPEYVLSGRKWGAGSPYNPASPPRTPGGTVTYSFMSDGIDLSSENAAYGSNVAITSLPTYQACFSTEITNAFAAWSAVANIQFTQVADNGQPFDSATAVGDIRIGAHTFDGAYGVGAHGYYPPPNGTSAAGDIHFDREEHWTCDASQVDIGIIALHEIGHALGLGHEFTLPAIMQPEYDPEISVLQQDDINGAKAIYGATRTPHCGTIGSEIWPGGGNVHIINCTVTVASGATLTIADGAIVKFESGTALLVQGALSVAGTGAKPVYITSNRDDTVGGDTNGDGAATSPSPGDWSRIEFQDSSDDATSLIDHAVIRYGGDCCSYGGITLISASPTIRDTTITLNQYDGIRASASAPTLVCNNISSNGDYGLYNLTAGTLVVAENQWWGSMNGPYHPTANPAGTGNAVSDGVDFTPWANQACSPVTTTATYRSAGSYDGWVRESSETSGLGGTINSTDYTLQVGDNYQDRQYRSILSFSTGGLPDNAVITSAKIKVCAAGTIVGTDPFSTHQGLVVDIRKRFFGSALALQTGDFQAAASRSRVGTFGTTTDTRGCYGYTATLSSSAYQYVNRTGSTQFRLRFLKDDNDDLGDDYTKFYSGNFYDSSYRPQLIIKYYLP